MNLPCWLCDVKPIESPRKPLCKRCYKLCHSRKLLHIFPSFSNRERKIKRALEKYGNNLSVDMEILNDGRTTLMAVGNKYGISREMVRLLYKTFYDRKYSEVKEIKKNNNIIKNEEMKKERNKFENRFSRAKKQCSRYTGIVAEALFYEKCKELEYDVTMKPGPYDAEVNGYYVDVKSAVVSSLTCHNGKQRYYKFSYSMKQFTKVDFYAFYIYEVETWYIIPKVIVSKPKSERHRTMFYVPKFDINSEKKHKYQDVGLYKEAWHLLKKT